MSTIENYRGEWSIKYAPSHPEDPIQRYGLCVFDILTSRAYAATLQNYHLHSKLRMPGECSWRTIQSPLRKCRPFAVNIDTTWYQKYGQGNRAGDLTRVSAIQLVCWGDSTASFCIIDGRGDHHEPEKKGSSGNLAWFELRLRTTTKSTTNRQSSMDFDTILG